MRLVCTAPMGELQLLAPNGGLYLVPSGEAFEVADDYGLSLLAQRGNVCLPDGSKVLAGLGLDELVALAVGRGLVVDEKPRKGALSDALSADGIFTPEPVQEG